VQRGTERLTAAGFEVVPFLPPATAATGRLAACDRERADRLAHAYAAPDVDALLAVAGGYGVTRMLPLLPVGLFEHADKPIVGYSDLTPLLNIAAAAGAPAVHGPMLRDLAGDADDAAFSALAALLKGDVEVYDRALASAEPAAAETAVAGPLWGGNLSLLAATVGTGAAPPHVPGRLLLVEDWDEPAYRVDRMFVQLDQVGGLADVGALLLGHFTRIRDVETDLGTSLARRITALAAERFPVVRGVPAGHAAPNLPFVLGATYRFTPDGIRLVRG